MADWRLEVIDDGEVQPRVTPREDLRRFGPLVVAFLLGWLAALVLPGQIPLP